MGKIDLSKLKDLMKGLGGLRVYLVLIWPAVILLACGAVLTAAWLMGSSLKQKANRESVPMGNLDKGNVEKFPRRWPGRSRKAISGCIPAGREPDKVVIGREHST